MSDMPSMIWAANNGHSYGMWLTDGCTAYTRTDLVDELIKAVNEFLTVAGSTGSIRVDNALAAIQGKGNGT